MTPLRFYEHFACALGTLFLLTLLCSLLTRSHIDLGAFGVFGFPIIALIYAFIRRVNQVQIVDEREALVSEIRELRIALHNKDHQSGY